MIEEVSSPKSRYDGEKLIDDSITEIFLESIKEVKVESYYLVQDYTELYPSILNGLKNISTSGNKKPAYYSTDFKEIYVTYEYPLFGDGGIITGFILHTKPNPLISMPGYTPTNTFTGVVIYVKGEYEAYAKNTYTTLTQAFFPKIYDEEMKLILEREMCYPDVLKEWGMVEYTTSEDLSQYQDRIGDYPLCIIARNIYGKYNTDIIINSDDAKKILSNEENIELLKNGKILIIID